MPRKCDNIYTSIQVYDMTAAARNRFYFSISSVPWQKLLIVFPEMVREDDGILNRQSSLSVFSRLLKALDICIPKDQNISLTFSGNLLNIIP